MALKLLLWINILELDDEKVEAYVCVGSTREGEFFQSNLYPLCGMNWLELTSKHLQKLDYAAYGANPPVWITGTFSKQQPMLIDFYIALFTSSPERKWGSCSYSRFRSSFIFAALAHPCLRDLFTASGLPARTQSNQWWSFKFDSLLIRCVKGSTSFHIPGGLRCL